MKLYFRHSFRVLGWCLLPWVWCGSAQTAQVDLPKKLSSAPPVSGTSSPGLSELVTQFGADYAEIGRFYDLPWSSERLERLNQLLERWQERLAAIRFDTLETPARIDYLRLRTKVTAEQPRLALERRRLAEMEALLPFRHAIQDLQQARWRMEAVDPQKAAASVSVIPADLKKLRKRIAKAGRPETEPEKVKSPDTTPDTSEADKIRIAPALARRASAAVDELRRTLKDWSTFYDGFVPEFGWWVKKPATDAQSALESYAKFLREEIAGLKGEDDDPLVGDPIGAEALAAD